MTPEVRERIEQIRHGIVPEGYKKTKVGIIPCEWDVQPLNKLLEFKNGINADKEKFGQGTKLISVRDILSDHPITYETIQGFVDVNEQQIEEFGVKYGDVLFQRSSENYEDVGTSNVYLDHNNTAVFSGFVIRGKKISEYNPVYLNALLRTSYVRKAIIRQAAGAQHINIGQESLAKVHITLTDNPEQKKIAEILTTQDKVIELKEKLLAEKQRQKKYLMQQLLTGKKLLQGFDAEWEKTPLKKLLKERKTYSPKGAEYPHVTLSTEGIYAKSDRYDRDHLVKDEDKEYKITHKGDICYNPANLKFGVICINNFGDAIFSPIYVTFEVVGNVSSAFLSNYLMRWDFINAVRKYEEGTVYERMAVKPEDFLKFEMMLPPYEEQVAIAEILSVADREIELLRHDIEQEKQKKKALMQLLLTGIVRV
ncbi:MAG: restriction endonuclease subunit S [Oscillospiraceae bacterium]|nr:restriction endonuclease subunit S [Oscillospiraceae bacterium]